MADSKYDTTIKIGMDADLSGGVQTEKQLDAIRRKAKQMGDDGTAAAVKATSALGTLRRSVMMLRSALTGFGVVALVQQAINSFKEWRKSIQDAEGKAKALRDAMREAADAKAAKEMAAAYNEVAESIAKAADARKRANDLLSEEVRIRREAEDANIDLEEAQALAAVDENDPAAEERRTAIKSQFAARRAQGAASRKREDVILRMTALDQEARTSDEAANALAATLGADRTELLRARISARSNRAFAAEMNDRDVTWYGRRQRTEEGDAVRAGYAKRADEAEARAEKLEADIKKKEAEIAKYRADAEDARTRHGMMGTALSAADTAGNAAGITSGMSTSAAARALGKKEAQIAADESTIAQGPGKIAALQKQIAAVEAQRSSAISADAKEQQDALLAQRALDSFNLSGRRRNGTGVQAQRSALEDDVARETAEASQSRAQLQSTLATLAATLKGLNADLKKVERDVDAAVKRQNATNDEAPEG